MLVVHDSVVGIRAANPLVNSAAGCIMQHIADESHNSGVFKLLLVEAEIRVCQLVCIQTGEYGVSAAFIRMCTGGFQYVANFLFREHPLKETVQISPSVPKSKRYVCTAAALLLVWFVCFSILKNLLSDTVLRIFL